MYMALKHSHMLFIALSVSFLAVRFLLSLLWIGHLQRWYLPRW